MSSATQATDMGTCALQRLYAVRPVWSDVQTATQAVGLGDHCLLHAGPPFADPFRPSAPILASAALCCVYEGWAADIDSAQCMILDGRVSLLPAQGYDVVTPLAAVISPTTSLVEITDLNSTGRCWALLPSGSGPQIRFGTANLAILERMRVRDQQLAIALKGYLAQQYVDLIPLAQAGLRRGDDLHAETSAATAALLAQLRANEAPTSVTEVLDAAPLFFLTLWMGACHLMLKATIGSEQPSLVIGLAGNGQDVGIRLSSAPQQWLTSAAMRPQGPRIAAANAIAAPMLGDSGVIDAAGFGAQAWGHAGAVRELMESWLPPGWMPDLSCLAGEHPAFAEFSLRTALDAGRAAQSINAPMIALAMLDECAELGMLGRGVCATTPASYAQPSQEQPTVNEPEILAMVNRAVDDYERALTGNDLTALDQLFWNSPHTLRYGAGEHLYGYAAIAEFRRFRADSGQLARHILERSVTTFGQTFAVANIVFQRPGSERLGRQTQSWICVGGQWQIAAAHVSWATS